MVAGKIELGPAEARILGCLLEKQRTTPDAYPLSLNALRLACNQSTNRHPIVDYEDATIRDGLHRLERRGLVRLASGAGSRAAKYRHLLAQALPLDDAEQALICVLLLRGAQTPGELKQRAERMHAFAALADVHATLETLMSRELVARHERRPGQKEDRYSHLLGVEEDDGDASDVAVDGAGRLVSSARGAEAASDPGEAGPEPAAAAPGSGSGSAAPPDAVAALAERVARLERELAELRATIAERMPDGGVAAATARADAADAADGADAGPAAGAAGLAAAPVR